MVAGLTEYLKARCFAKHTLYDAGEVVIATQRPALYNMVHFHLPCSKPAPAMGTLVGVVRHLSGLLSAVLRSPTLEGGAEGATYEAKVATLRPLAIVTGARYSLGHLVFPP